MPTEQLKTWAKESNKSLSEAEKCWNQAKKQADKMFPKGENDPGYWRFVNFRTRYCLDLEQK